MIKLAKIVLGTECDEDAEDFLRWIAILCVLFVGFRLALEIKLAI